MLAKLDAIDFSLLTLNHLAPCCVIWNERYRCAPVSTITHVETIDALISHDHIEVSASIFVRLSITHPIINRLRFHLHSIIDDVLAVFAGLGLISFKEP